RRTQAPSGDRARWLSERLLHGPTGRFSTRPQMRMPHTTPEKLTTRASFALPLLGQNRIAPAPPVVVGQWLLEEELAVLVLKQEGLLFSTFDFLDQETPAFEVAEDGHSGDLRHHNPDS